MDTRNQLQARIETKGRTLATHPVFTAVRAIEDLRIFMEWHVFAVWDFMSLLKRLQREFTTLSVPWTAPDSARIAGSSTKS
ncbi:DUF3050 domain-containing protein [Trinickia sp. LjRoot230]